MIEKNKNELMHMQDELLGDIKEVEIKINEKFKSLTQSLEEKNLELAKKIFLLEKSYDTLHQQIQSTSSEFKNSKEISNKIASINKAFEDNNSRLEKKIIDIQENLKETIFRYDRAIAENFTIPGLIGPKAPFLNLRELIIAIYKRSNESLKLKEQQGIDLKKYKEKMDNVINMNKNEFIILENKINKSFKSKMDDLEDRFNKRIDVVEDRFNTMRQENGKYAYDIQMKCNEVKKSCEKVSNQLIQSFNENNSEFIQYKNSFKEMNDKLKKFQENYKLFEEELNNINEKFEDNNKKNMSNFSVLDNKINELEKSFLLLKKGVNDEFSKSNYITGYKVDEEKNSLLSNNYIKKLLEKTLKEERQNILSKSLIKNNLDEMNEGNENNKKINNILYDGDFFRDQNQMLNSSNNDFSSEINGIKKAKMPIYRIRSGKIFNHYPFISHDNCTNNDESLTKIISKDFNSDRTEYIKHTSNFNLQKKKIEKEICFPYAHHKYIYLEKKIDIIGKAMVDNYNKIISQMNILIKKGNNSNDYKYIEPIKSKENEQNEQNKTDFIHSIRNNDKKKDNLICSNSFLKYKYTKLNLKKSKINQRTKFLKKTIEQGSTN